MRAEIEEFILNEGIREVYIYDKFKNKFVSNDSDEYTKDIHNAQIFDTETAQLIVGCNENKKIVYFDEY